MICADEALVVDCGDAEPIIHHLEGKRLKGILLTHGHFDHIYGLNEVCAAFPEAKVYTNESGREMLLNERKNMSLYHETPFTFQYPERIRLIGDGDPIELSDGLTVKVMATPGHNKSCLSFIVGDALFTGDALIPGKKLVTNLPGSDKAEALVSKQKLEQLSMEFTIYPGHPSEM